MKTIFLVLSRPRTQSTALDLSLDGPRISLFLTATCLSPLSTVTARLSASQSHRDLLLLDLYASQSLWVKIKIEVLMAAVQTLLLATFYSQVVSVVPNNSSLLSSIWYASISHSHSIFRFHSHSQSLFRCFGTVYDMAVDLTSETIVIVGQDKKIKTFDVATWRLIRSYNHDKDFGEPIKGK
ncbi:hypothetical protein P8452_71416 [Trifolium repens]|nr:hypothetical protein P8452_71416 [Trifolium repens]